MPEADPTADPTKPDPTKPDPTKPDPAAADPTDGGLGAGGKAALDAERSERKAAQKAAKDAKDALDALTAKTATDAEKAAAETARAIAEAKAEVRNEVAAAASARLLKSEIRVAASGVLADPADAAALLGDTERFLDKDGEPDEKAIKAAIAQLVKDKPYLAVAGSRPNALAGGGAKPSSGFSMNDVIRAETGRG